jgi:hypothetical protein
MATSSARASAAKKRTEPEDDRDAAGAAGAK